MDACLNFDAQKLWFTKNDENISIAFKDVKENETWRLGLSDGIKLMSSIEETT